RIKDTIIVSGFNVFPTEVEDVIRGRPDVAEVAVVGIPDERTGERVKAYVVPEAGATPTLGEIQAWCRERLARYKCPVEVEVVAGLPHGLAGTGLRRGRRDCRRAAARAPASPDAPAGRGAGPGPARVR